MDAKKENKSFSDQVQQMCRNTTPFIVNDMKSTAHLERDTWKERNVVKHGDYATIEGKFVRRTFMQWLRGEEKKLQLFKVIRE